MSKGAWKSKKQVDPEQVVKLFRLGCTVAEVADFFGFSQTWIEVKFKKERIKGYAERKAKLREFQWRSAERGNVAMLIFLGKNELGQNDQIKVVGNGIVLSYPEEKATK